MQLPVQLSPPLALAVLSIAACQIALVWWYQRKRTNPLPPGPSALPFLGNAHQIPLQYPERIFSQWARTYGGVMYLRLFKKSVLILDSVKAAQDLMDKRGAKFSDRPQLTLITDVFAFKPMMFTMPYGDLWRRHRKWYQASLESKAALDTYNAVQEIETCTLLSALVSDSGHFADQVKRFTGAILLEIVYGHAVTSVKDDLIRLSDEMMTQAVSAGSLVATLLDFFPFLMHIPEWFPGGGFKREGARVRHLMRQLLDVPFNEVQQAMLEGSGKACLTTYMLEEQAEHGDLTPDDVDNIKGAATLLFIGACVAQTITTLLTFFLAMVLHPEVVHKAQAEIDRVVGRTRLPTLMDRDALPYLDQVLKEVYRWNPPVPLGIPHQVRDDDVYNGRHIPGGSMVVSNIWSMSRDPDTYEDADRFWPERYEGKSSDELARSDPRRIVYGFGRSRLCPGRFLADSSIWLAAARVIATLDIRKVLDAEGKEITPSAEFISGAVSHPKPFSLDIRPRDEVAETLIAQ
ncbi:hypothetical protein IEO21_09009 [Rhodonia placenta]|uniref:Cytochrome P450 n=1 Tax=Rhodonia placenta TaxID=104341 RepID=A0A8H7NVB8_9APHY|nr:hypothetical protein IEO21_09009 [Postia placenta]